MAKFNSCSRCEFGTETSRGVCQKAFAERVSVATISDPAIRLACQNYLVDLKLPYRQLADWVGDVLRDFPGRFRSEEGEIVPVPGIASILTDGIDFWMRATIGGGKWQTIAEVPDLRTESRARWALIATVIRIAETLQPIC